MLGRHTRSLRAFCSQAAKPKLVKVNVRVGEKAFTFEYPENSKLGPNLERSRVPLEFECGFSCSCGTCPVKLNRQDFQTLEKTQPILEAEQKVLVENSFDEHTRLSCQVTVKAELSGVTFIVEK